jgi:hypothetical protein
MRKLICVCHSYPQLLCWCFILAACLEDMGEACIVATSEVVLNASFAHISSPTR